MTSKARSSELTEAISALIVQQPFFASLLFDLMDIRESDHTPGGSGLPTACTDGREIVINPQFFKKLDVKERLFVLAHEIAHVILQHPERMRKYGQLGVGPDMKPFSARKYNHAADYVINSYLTELGVGKQPLNSLSNPHVTSKDLVDDIYCKLPDEEDDDQGSDGWDTHLPQAGDAPDKATIQRAVKQAATAQKMKGNMPGGMQRLIDEICETQVSWQDYLRKTIVTSQGSDQSTWNRPNRRRLAVAPHIYWPGRCGSKSGSVGVCIDTSGSIGETELKVFLGELHGILSDVSPEMIYVGYVDTQLHGGFHEITDVSELLHLGQKAAGGAGTNLPVFYDELAKEGLEPEYIIFLTDGYTDFGDEPNVPVIWCMTTDVKAPYGINVHVKLPGAGGLC